MNSLWQIWLRLTVSHFVLRWDYFVQALVVDKVFFGQRVGRRRLRPDVLTQVVPTLVMVLFGVVSLIYLLVPSMAQTPLQRVILFVQLPPSAARVHMAIIFVTWACLCLFTSFYEVSRRLLGLQHLAVLAIGPDKGFKPHWFGLDQAEYAEFDKYRSFVLKSDWWTNLTIGCLGTAMMIISAKFEGAFEQSWWLSCLWLLAFFFFVFYIRYPLYALPGLFFILVKYLCIKQRALLRRFDTLIGTCRTLVKSLRSHQKTRLNISKAVILSRFHSLDRHHIELSNEIEAYNVGFWSSYLSCFCLLISVLITYLTNVIFLTSLPVYGHAVLDIVWFAHTSCLIMVINAANRITRGHRQYQHKLLLFYHQARHLKVFNNRILFKVT